MQSPTFLKIAEVRTRIENDFLPVLQTIQQIKSGTLPEFDLKDYENIVDIRPGYKVVDGELTDTKAIVILVKSVSGKAIPEEINHIATDVDIVSPFEYIRKQNKEKVESLLPGTQVNNTKYLLDSSEFDTEGFVAESFVPKIGYQPPTDFTLDAVDEDITLICHVSPEDGWEQLSEFLTGVEQELRVGMYDFSAPGIEQSLIDVARSGADINLVYDGKPAAGVGKGNKADDKTEDEIIKSIDAAKTGQFVHVKASLNKGGLFANAYHIKVAVKDKKMFWLSSGNWQSSNQPDMSKTSSFASALQNYNREWHIIVTNDKLSETYYKFLKYDLEQSVNKAQGFVSLNTGETDLHDILLPVNALVRTTGLKKFPPKVITARMKIQPVLTPDNYIAQIRPLIENATTRIYFQNQYIHIGKTMTDEFTGLLTALKDKAETLDVKIILRYEPDARLMVENLKAFGFDSSKIRIQNNCHNKGIIIDDEIIVLGSHNGSNDGMEFNRDASLIIYNSEVQNYYEEVFQFDWDNLAKSGIGKEAASGDQEGFLAGGDVLQNWESAFD
ncbi:phospholipase D-like domain-containing protein [Mucilaginibacter paludis]|uniref:phospholipase D n=1 Tax=Mucilaginibacter paludis DSM 18603 TaxID=714943 RepID=H1YA18_9SPHI|nr:phospholipase D-like domain-containing protein [Mucilaginibacter paludis]EHQ25002.1 hypothetical protein, putative protease [Mucilaginibacter paludis DSM 18603]